MKFSLLWTLNLLVSRTCYFNIVTNNYHFVAKSKVISRSFSLSKESFPRYLCRITWSITERFWKYLFFPLADPACAARSDPASGWSDSAAPGSAGSASADHHPAAPGSHHSRTEPGAVFSSLKCPVVINITDHGLSILCGSAGAADQRAGAAGGADRWRTDHCLSACQRRWYRPATG